METLKQIENIKFEGDLDNALGCLWKIREGNKSQFIAYGKSWLEKIIAERVKSETLEKLRDNTTFKKEGIFREAYIKHLGDMKKITASMNISDRTYFRYKAEFIDEETIKLVRKTKYNLKPNGDERN